MDKYFGFAKELVDKGLATVVDTYSDNNLYDLIIHFDEDIPFYLDIARLAKGRVLDIGCGTGRVMRPLLDAGLDVVGLDLSAAMLELANQKLTSLGYSPQLVKGDMRTFDVQGEFGAAIIPYCAMIYMLNDHDRRQVFDRVYKHLSPGGLLAFDFDAGSNRIGQSQPWLGIQGVNPLTGEVLVNTVQMNGLSEEVRVINQINYRTKAGLTKIEVTASVEASVRADKMEVLLSQTGFVVENVFKDYDRSTYDGGDECIIIARKIVS